MWSPGRWIPVIAASVAIALTAGTVWYYLPDYRRLIVIGAYTIPSHVLVTPFPQEPAVLYGAKYYAPWIIAAVMTLGSCFSGFLDYRLLSPLLAGHAIRSRFEGTALYKKLVALFAIAPFWLLTAVNLLPIPLSPFKLLSIVQGYPLWKYEISLLVGRAPRYYLLAVLGYLWQPPTALLAAVTVAFVLTCLGHEDRPPLPMASLQTDRPANSVEEDLNYNGLPTGRRLYRVS